METFVPAAPSPAFRTRYGLVYQIDLLEKINERYPLAGKRVLEIGGSNLPREVVFDWLQAERWIAVDRIEPGMHRRFWAEHYANEGVIELAPLTDLNRLRSYALINGSAEDVNPTFHGAFDVVVSLTAFEHMLRLDAVLAAAYAALAPGGRLLSLFYPIWSGREGHHLPEFRDKSGRYLSFLSSPIPPWGHLLYRPGEMRRILAPHTDPESVERMIYEIYHSPDLNRYFVEDYIAAMENSPFTDLGVMPVSISGIDDETQATLERLHPGRRHFSNNGLFLHGRKPE